MLADEGSLGTMNVNAYAAPSAAEPLVRSTIERRDVGPRDVLIEIRYAGICHSDIHTVRGEWGPVAYPLTVGHEIVGRVAEVGSEVTKHTVGDRVGVGCMVNACRECENCNAGQEQYCATYPALKGQACRSLPRWLRGQAACGRLTAPQPSTPRWAMLRAAL